MKKNLLAVFVLLTTVCSSSFAQLEVGKMEEGKAVLTYDKTKLLADFNANLLKASGIDGKFTNVVIEKKGDLGYFLVFTGVLIKSTFSTKLAGTLILADDGLTCTTTDCSSESFGCIPNLTSCTPCANKGKCTKTLSLKSLLVAN